jgi:hypothetical protein
MTETDLTAANRAVNRICRAFNKEMMKYNKKGNIFAIYAGVCQYDFNSIESTVRNCGANLGLAKKAGKLKVVTGIYTRLRNLSFSKRMEVG